MKSHAHFSGSQHTGDKTKKIRIELTSAFSPSHLQRRLCMPVPASRSPFFHHRCCCRLLSPAASTDTHTRTQPKKWARKGEGGLPLPPSSPTAAPTMARETNVLMVKDLKLCLCVRARVCDNLLVDVFPVLGWLGVPCLLSFHYFGFLVVLCQPV